MLALALAALLVIRYSLLVAARSRHRRAHACRMR